MQASIWTCALIFAYVRDRPGSGVEPLSPIHLLSLKGICPKVIVKKNGLSCKVPPLKRKKYPKYILMNAHCRESTNTEGNKERNKILIILYDKSDSFLKICLFLWMYRRLQSNTMNYIYILVIQNFSERKFSKSSFSEQCDCWKNHIILLISPLYGVLLD